MKSFSATAVLAAALLAVISSTSAHAAKLTNLDEKPYVITVFEGDNQRQVEIAPLSEIEDLCSAGCEVQFGDDPQAYEVAAGGVFVIENGALYDDTPEGPDAGGMDPQGEAYEAPLPGEIGDMGGESAPQDPNAH